MHLRGGVGSEWVYSPPSFQIILIWDNAGPSTKNLSIGSLAFTWDKHIDFGLVGLLWLSFLFSLQMFICAGVVAGVCHRSVVNEQRRRVVSGENEGVCRQRLGPDHVPFTGAADVQHGTGLQGELLLIGDNGWR